MKKILLSFALAVGLLASASTLQAQTVNMSRYITLTVKKDSAIRLDFMAASNGTPVRIVSGSTTQDITVGTNWYNGNDPSTYTVTARASTMTVYGDLTGFGCEMNRANLTVLDPSHNTQLKELFCNENTLNSLDVSKNTQLEKLWCQNNNLTTLDVSKNTELDGLNCANNKLNSLDVSKNTQLKKLYCSDNKFTTATLDRIYCALPDRTSETNGAIQPVYNSSSSNHATVLATNAQNAIAKNWKVQYYENDIDIPTTTGSYVCSAPEPNMDSYITLTVTDGAAIKLDFKAAAKGTPVRIVSGSNTQDITVGTGWYNNNIPSTYTVAAGASTMTVYGDLTGFGCEMNRANLTVLDPSHNTQLKELFCNENTLNSLDVSKNTQLEKLYCYDNNFTTAALDNIYCTLPNRTGKEYGVIYPVYNSSSSNHATVLATNAANATSKNWKVQYSDGNVNITTTGSYVCSAPQPNMDSYITLTVTNGAAIKLDFWAAAAATPVRIVSGSNTQDITVGTGWYDGHTPSSFTVTAGSTTMTVYGDIIMFDCSKNGANLTALDPSHNTQLTVLNCRNNSLNSLDVSKNTQLKKLYCHGNSFSTQALDDIYCSLPDRTGNTNGVIQPVYNSSSSDHATVLATNKTNATAKNWKVQYYSNDADIATTGKHKCSATDIAEADAEQALTLYPNPVADVLYLSATARTIRVYDIYGTEVAHATDTDRVEVSHLPAGIYTVKADGTVAKMVKR